MRFYAEIFIDSPPERVWEVLTDVQTLVNSNMGVAKIEGDLGLGNTIKLWAEISPDRAFTLKIAEFNPPESMVWSSGLPLGLFKGVRTFTLRPEEGGTKFEMQETFTGLMLPLIAKSIPNLQPEFEKFANGLKQQCAIENPSA